MSILRREISKRFIPGPREAVPFFYIALDQLLEQIFASSAIKIQGYSKVVETVDPRSSLKNSNVHHCVDVYALVEEEGVGAELPVFNKLYSHELAGIEFIQGNGVAALYKVNEADQDVPEELLPAFRYLRKALQTRKDKTCADDFSLDTLGFCLKTMSRKTSMLYPVDRVRVARADLMEQQRKEAEKLQGNRSRKSFDRESVTTSFSGTTFCE